MLKRGSINRLPAILSIAMAGIALPITAAWGQTEAADPLAAHFTVAELRQKTDEELTEMLANLPQYNPADRRVLFTHVLSRMRFNDRYQRKMRGRVGSFYGQRIIRRADGSLVLQRRMVQQHQLPVDQDTVGSERVVSSFGQGFEKRSRSRKPAQITIQTTTTLTRPAASLEVQAASAPKAPEPQAEHQAP